MRVGMFFERLTDWLAANAPSMPIPMDGDGHDVRAVNCQCRACGLTQLVSHERECAGCGETVSAYLDHVGRVAV